MNPSNFPCLISSLDRVNSLLRLGNNRIVGWRVVHLRIQTANRKIIEIEHVKSYNVTLVPRRGGLEEVRKHKCVTTNGTRIAFPDKFPGFMLDNFVKGRDSAMWKRRDASIHYDKKRIWLPDASWVRKIYSAGLVSLLRLST